MRKKLCFVLAFLLVTFLLSTLVVAQEDEGVEKAYACLKEKVENNCDKLSYEEIVFSLLALAYDNDLQRECKTALIDKGEERECWPSNNCNIKATAQAIIALNHIGENTQDAEDWLLERKGASDLIWYLQIDTQEEATCTIKYDSKEYTVIVNEDKTLNNGAGSCLSLTGDGYWLQISSSCFDKNFTISCDKDFVTNLLYKKKDSNIIYVSSETNSAPADGTTKHSVDAFCFKIGNECNYEASLWATLALAKAGRDIGVFLPYLVAYAPDNEEYMPYAFLYLLTGYDEYRSELVLRQKQNKYWQESDNKYYDTALALLALQDTGAEEKDNAKEWLLEIQTDDGCWHNNNIRDTAFLLYAGWPKEPSLAGGTTIDYCSDYGYFCMPRQECADVGGEILEDYYCSGMNVCCSQPPENKSCDEKGGIICDADEECTGSVVEASDTSNCCIGSCVKKEAGRNECEQQGFICRFGCRVNEEQMPQYSCPGEKVCCAPKASEEKRSYWWIWLLIFLIILVALGIVFRNRLRIWFFKMKRGKGVTQGKRPPSPPTAPTPVKRVPQVMPRTLPSATRRILPTKPISKTDKELEETLKKLREISK